MGPVTLQHKVDREKMQKCVNPIPQTVLNCRRNQAYERVIDICEKLHVSVASHFRS